MWSATMDCGQCLPIDTVGDNMLVMYLVDRYSSTTVEFRLRKMNKGATPEASSPVKLTMALD